MKKTLLLAAFISAFTFSTQAAAAKKGDYCDTDRLSSEYKYQTISGSQTVFQCGTLGRVSIKEIYERGWRVVLINHPPNNPQYTYMVIEEQ